MDLKNKKDEFIIVYANKKESKQGRNIPRPVPKLYLSILSPEADYRYINKLPTNNR